MEGTRSAEGGLVDGEDGALAAEIGEESVRRESWSCGDGADADADAETLVV